MTPFRLTSLNGLENITSIGEDLDIVNNDVLPQCIVDNWISGVTIGGMVATTPNGSIDPNLCL